MTGQVLQELANPISSIPQPPLRVLLAEDDPIHARLIRRAVAPISDRFAITHVTDGASALEAVLRQDADAGVDLVLLDLCMPRKTGFEVLEAIRSDRRTQGIPVVIVSTSERRDEIERCYRLGANAYVCKVLRFEELARSLMALASFWLRRSIPEGRCQVAF